MRRSPYDGLTLVELRVLDSEQIDFDGGARTIYTLRQLVSLRDSESETYELDQMLEGLPRESAPDLEGSFR